MLRKFQNEQTSVSFSLRSPFVDPSLCLRYSFVHPSHQSEEISEGTAMELWESYETRTEADIRFIIVLSLFP